MSASSLKSFRPLAIAGAVSAVSLLLYGCGAPERLPSDLSMDGSKDVLKEKIIAPIKGVMKRRTSRSSSSSRDAA